MDVVDMQVSVFVFSMHEAILIVFYLIILLYSVILHEVSHGVVALWLGDKTAKYAGRLTLNPKSHIDPFGSIGVPILMLLASGFQWAFGWAKPVPYNPFNLSNQKWGPLLVALAGPATNILIATVAAVLAKIVFLPTLVKVNIMGHFQNWSDVATVISASPAGIAYELLLMVIFWNVLLAVFNLIPVPPLDGSKLLYTIFPISTQAQMMMEQFGLFILLFIMIFLYSPISALIGFMINLFFGMTL